MWLDRCLLVGLTLAAPMAASADTLGIRASTGLPQLSVVDGQAQAWRYTTLRVDASVFGVEAKLPGCIASLRAALPVVAAAHPSADCAASSVNSAQTIASPELKGRVRLPRAFDGAPEVELSVTTWGATSGGTRNGGEPGGTEVDLRVSQAVGPVSFFAGSSTPLRVTASADAWRTQYAGFKWRPAARHGLEFESQLGRDVVTGERDREQTLRYAYTAGPRERVRVYVSRLGESAADRRRAGVAADWSF